MTPSLVFVHGWGCDAGFWDPLAAQLKEFLQQRIERGFFGKTPRSFQPQEGQILIGHSLGLMHGLSSRHAWAGWVAINSFARFNGDCVPAPVLRDMRRRLSRDTEKTVRDFYELIGGENHPPSGSPHVDLLTAGLDELRDLDVTETIRSMAVPGLVLASAADPLVPKPVSQSFALLAPAVTIEWGAACGHMFPLTDTSWCAALIREFLASLL